VVAAFDGMQPTRAQVVPVGPLLMMTKLFRAGTIWLREKFPAEPAPITATSTLRSIW